MSAKTTLKPVNSNEKTPPIYAKSRGKESLNDTVAKREGIDKLVDRSRYGDNKKDWK